jgi:hypothetical protein
MAIVTIPHEALPQNRPLSGGPTQRYLSENLVQAAGRRENPLFSENPNRSSGR